MSVVLKIALKDLRRRRRSPLSVLSMLLIPVVLTAIVGMVFGGSGETDIEGIRVLFVDQDGRLAGKFIRQGLSAPGSGKLLEIKEVDLEEGRRLIDSGKASALVVVPAGFTDSLLNGSYTEITVVKNPSEIFLPMVVEEIVRTEALMLDGALDIFDEPIASFREMLKGSGWPAPEKITELVNAAGDRIRLVAPYFKDSLVTIEREARGSEGNNSMANIFNFTFVGSMALGLFFISMIALGDLLREMNSGTMQRILTTPVGVMQFVTGKALYGVLLTGTSYVILLAVAFVVFHARTDSPGALLALSAGIILLFPGLITLVYGIIRNERMASSIVPSIIVGLCMIGGAMIPYEQMGSSLRRIAPYSPVFWVVDGLKKVVVFDGGFSDVALNVLVIYVLAFASLLMGIFFIYRRVRGGVG